MNLSRIKFISISTLLLAVFFKHGDAIRLKRLLKIPLGEDNEPDVSEKNVAESRSNINTRSIELKDYLRGFDKHDESDMHHSSERQKNSRDSNKESVVYNNIFIKPASEDQSWHPQPLPIDSEDDSSESRICSNPANWAICASSKIKEQENSQLYANTADLWSSILNLVGYYGKNFETINKHQRALTEPKPSPSKTNVFGRSAGAGTITSSTLEKSAKTNVDKTNKS